MDYLSGGDLRYHICRHRRFSEETTRKSTDLALTFLLFLGFFVACLVSGLEYFHKKSIIHRDIKPENLVVDSDGKWLQSRCVFFDNLVFAGYVRITDFGIARVWREENAQDTSGTPGYMAPEVMCRQNHTTSVDFFAVGVMAYECMFGRVSCSYPPIVDRSNMIFIEALYRQVEEGDTWPYFVKTNSN